MKICPLPRLCATVVSTLLIFVCAGAIYAQAIPTCSSVVTYDYPGGTCLVKVDRTVPGSPLPVQVPPKTIVLIEVDGQRQTEFIKFSTTTDAVAKPDILGAFVKQFVSPLSGIVIKTDVQSFDGSDDPIYIEQVRIAASLKGSTTVVNKASTEVSCLQTFSTFDEKASACTNGAAGTLDVANFDPALVKTKGDVTSALEVRLPLAELKRLDDDIKTKITACPAPVEQTLDNQATFTEDSEKRRMCLSFVDYLQQNQNRLNDASSAILASQKTLIQVQPVLDTLSSPKQTPAQPFKNDANKKATVKITAIEAIGKTSTDVASVVITWQSTRLVLSTGVMLSTLKNNTYANSPIYDSTGAPMLNAGKALTQVTVTHTRPSVVFPLVMGNYRVHSFSEGCNGNCAFLIGGGMGANLSSKTADFAVGPSFQYGSVLFTPVLHYGRQLGLTNGVKVGDQLGTSPPTLPTNSSYKPAFGFALSYRIPIP